MDKRTPNRADFVASNEKARLYTIDKLARVIRKTRLDFSAQAVYPHLLRYQMITYLNWTRSSR